MLFSFHDHYKQHDITDYINDTEQFYQTAYFLIFDFLISEKMDQSSQLL